MPVVLKFGGTSVEDTAAVRRVAGIVATHAGGCGVVVVSAMSRVTDALLASVDTRDSAGLEPHFARHRAVAVDLLDGAAADAFERELGDARVGIDRLLGRIRSGESVPVIRDEVVAYGERLSTALLAAVLRASGLPASAVDARRCIVTDATPGRATPDLAETDRRTRAELEPLLAEGRIPVLGGFIAATPGGVTTTLGRGGSDYTAALVGAALGVRELQIWTDVSGVLTSDPRIVPAARTIPHLSYAEAAELAYFGAKVLHPKTIQPALARGIPVRIVNSRAPADPGTVVTSDAERWPGAVKSIAHKVGITVLQITSARMLGAYGFLGALFGVFERHKVPVDVVTTSEVSLSVTVEDGAHLDPVIRELQTLGDVLVERGRAIVCIVGDGLRTTPWIAARVFETIRDINVSLISQGASRVNLTFVVEEPQVRAAVTRLHAALLEGPEERVVRPPVAGEVLEPDELARRLIDIPSVSGGEAAVAEFLGAYLEGQGYAVDVLETAGRPSLFAHTEHPAQLVFCTHLDTVAPFVAASEDRDFIYGRGACDAKGIIAAQVAAAARLRAAGVGTVGLLFVADEEQGSLGARAANDHPAAAACRWLVVGEPTDNVLATGSKGSMRLRLTAVGTGGHSAYPERGRSAIHTLLDVLADVRRVAWPADPVFGATTCNIGIVSGGVGANVIAPDARAELQLRLATDEAPVRSLVEQAVAGRAAIEWLSVTPRMRLASVPGFEECVVGFTTDAPHLANWGTAVLLGPGSIYDAHMPRERLAKAELARGVEQYVRLARVLLAHPARMATSP